MSFQPGEIAEKEFLIKVRGYDRSEVRAFLRAVAAQYQSLVDLLQEAAGNGPTAEADGCACRCARDAGLILQKVAEDELMELRRARAEVLALIRELGRSPRPLAASVQEEWSGCSGRSIGMEPESVGDEGGQAQPLRLERAVARRGDGE